MHDLDRALMEFEHESNPGYGDDPHGEFEFGSSELEGSGLLDSAEEMEMASDLLTVNSDQELEQFLGKLVRNVSRKVGQLVKSPVGKALGNVLKGVAKKALPIAGSAIGTALMPGIGTAAGGMLGNMASQMFGLELEGLSPEDQEMETAKRFVRLAAEAAANAARAGDSGSPVDVARQAIVAAARQHAPGLLRSGGGGNGNRSGTRGQSGRWVRRGDKIILFGI